MQGMEKKLYFCIIVIIVNTLQISIIFIMLPGLSMAFENAYHLFFLKSPIRASGQCLLFRSSVIPFVSVVGGKDFIYIL